MTAVAVESQGVCPVQAPRDFTQMTPHELREFVRETARHEAQLASVRMGAVRELERRDVAKSAGAPSTGALISGDFGGNRPAADRQVRTARNLETATLTDRALSAGEISVEQAEIVARAVVGLPADLDEHTRLRVEKALISDAKIFTIRDLRRRVLRISDLYAPKPEADADENERLRRQEARAWQHTELWFGGQVPEVRFDMFKNCLDAVAAPRRRHLEVDAAEDELTSNQRYGRAFCTWIEHLPTDGFPTTGGTPATVTVNLDFDTLKHQLAAAGTISTGSRISAGEARRLACSTGILPKVLNGKSLPLDMGRSKRLFTPAQRVALAERDLGCTFPGCDRPPGWCEAHHINHWANGGTTNLEDGALGCPFHHHYIHENSIPVRIHDDVVEYLIDGIWQRNHRWRT